MTKEEARSLVGRTVLYSSGHGEPELVVIENAAEFSVAISWPGSGRRDMVTAGDLMPLPGEGADPVAVTQAALNDFAAEVIKSSRRNAGQVEDALGALRELNWASGLDFEGTPPAPPGASRDYHAGLAVRHTWSLDIARAREKSRAAAEAARLEYAVPEEAAAVLRRSRASAPALVYVITHASLGAAKVGVSDAAGERIAVHRRAGWQLIAAFQVAADAAAAIEADVLDWWRSDLGLPPYLTRAQMPQDGWTETADASRIDLAATVTHVCELALLPHSRPAAATA